MTHKLNRLLALVLAVIMTFSMLLVPVEAASFYDVKDGAWYAAAVEYVSEKGWMAGVSETSFAPNKEVTRGMMVTVLARLAEAKIDNDTAAFEDTAAGKWYTGAAAWAAEQGIVSGVGNGRFAPNRAITRQDLCVMLYGYIKAMGIELENTIDRTFSDMDTVAKYAREAVIYCTGTGLISGFEDSTFRPKDSATRAQLAQILMRLDLLVKGEEAPADPMPAQSFEGNAGEDMTISVNAPEGALPEHTKMNVSRVSDEMSLAALKSLVNNKIYAAADISFSKGSVELEPKTEVEVQLELAGLDGIENPTVVHIRDDGTVEYINSEMVSTNRDGSGKALRFHAKDFSVYAVTEGSGTGFYNVTVEFYARANGSSGDWQLINKQIVRSDQLGANKTPVTDPGVPTIDENQSFEGWFEATTAPASFSDADADEGQSVADINDTVNGQSGAATLKYYALIYDVVYITYHDQAGNVLETESNHVTFAADGTATLAKVFEKTYIPYKGDQQFFGWTPQSNVKVENGEMVLGDYPEYVSTDESAYYKVDGNPVDPPLAFSKSNNDLHVYPFLARGYWLIFDNNISVNNDASHNNFNDSTSASYTAPVLYMAGVNTVKPANPTRTGYKFDDGTANAQWYSDPGMTRPFTFGQPLTADTTVYAKWTPDTADYYVVYWKQQATDSVNAAEKHYDYVDRVKKTATTGTPVSLNSSVTTYNVAANTEDPYYFEYSAADSTTGSVQVKGDGTTVLNVRYNRKTITFRFGPATAKYYVESSPDWSKHYVYYVKSGSTYLECQRVSSSGSYVYFTEYTGSLSSSGTYYMLLDNTFCQLVYSSGSWYISYDGSYYYTSASDNGKVYTRSTSAPSTLYYQKYELTSATTTLRGLYGHQLDTNDWPAASSGKCWNNFDESDKTVYQYPMPLLEFVPTWQEGTTLQQDFYEQDYSTSVIKVYYYGASLSNTSYYSVKLNEGTTTKGGKWYPNESVQGFTIKGYKFASSLPAANTTWTSCTSTSEISVGESETRNLYIAFDRNQYNLVFSSTTANGTANDTVSVYYDAPLSSYENRQPINSNPGYYFDGWYADANCETPFVFSGNMPARNVMVYAKWTMIRFRTVLDYNAPAAEVTFPGNQADSFRLNYGESVQESAIMAAERPGYILLGWYYTDNKGKEQDFNFHMGAHEDMADMNYGQRLKNSAGQYIETEAEFKARMNGDTRWDTYKVPHVTNSNGEEITEWDDRYDTDWATHDYSSEYAAAGYASAEKMREARSMQRNVLGYIRIYAKWRENPEGLTGVNVKYFADTDYEHYDKVQEGYFNPNQSKDVWDDPYIYTNRAEAYAQAASSPFNVKQKFLYWEIVNEAGDVVKTVYPGQTFTVQTGDAHYTHTLKDQYVVCEHKDENDVSTIEAVAAIAPTCTATGLKAHYRCTLCGRLFTDAAGTERTTLAAQTEPALGHDVTGVEWSKDATNHWHVCNRCHQIVDSAAHTMVQTAYTAPSGGNPGSRTETCTVCGHSVTTEFNGYTVHFSVPDVVTAPADQVVEPGNNADLTVTPTGTIEGYTFLGWVAETVDNSTTAVTPLESYTVTADTTLYALYSHIEDSGTVFELLTSAPSDWTGNYVITNNNTTTKYVLKGVTGSASGTNVESASNCSTLAASGITMENNRLTNVSNDYIMVLAASGSYYSVQSLSTSAYYGLNSSSYLYAYSTLNTTYCRWTPAINTSGAAQLLNSFNSGNTPYFGFSTSNSYFWSASTSNANVLQLWKETQSSTTTWTTEISTYTVNFTVPSGVSEVSSMSAVGGASITLPTAAAPSGYTFAGWVTDDVTETTTAPSYLTGSYTVNGNVTLKALYTRSVTTGGTFTRVTSSQSDWSGNYVITRGNDSSLYAMKGLSGNVWYEGREYGGATPYASTGMSLSGSTLSNVSDYYVFKFTTSGSYYTIQNAATGTYVSRIVDSTYGPELYALTASYESLDTYNKWTPAYASGNVTLTNYATTSNTNFTLLGFTDDSGYFWVDGSSGSNVNNIYLWKETTAAGATSYYTTSPAALSGYTVSFSVPSGVTAVASQTVTAGEGSVLPSAEAPSGSFFVGWATSAMSDTTAPTGYYASGALFTPTGNTTLYAVYYYTDSYYALQTAMPSSVPGTYVISSGKTSSGYMLLDRSSAGTLENTSYRTNINSAGVSITTLNGKTIMRNVPEANTFSFSTYSSTYSTYYAISNNSGLYLYDYYSSSSYSLRVQDVSSTTVNTSAWGITYSSGLFLLKPYNYSHYIQYSSSGYFELNSSQTGVYLWKYTTDYHYTSNPAATSAVPGTVEVENRDGELVTRTLPVAEASVLPEEVEEPVEAVRTVENVAEPVTEPVETRGLNPGQPVTVTNTVWEPVDTINLGEEYLIGYTATNSVTNETKTYLMMSYNPADSAYYTSANITGYTADKVCYAIPAILDASGNVTGVDTTNFSGATLNHAAWTFAEGSTSEKYRIQSVYDTSKYLRVDYDSSSYSTYLGLYPAAYASSYSQYWMWDSASKHLYYFYSSSYLTKYISVLTNTSSGEVTCFDADADSNYAKSLQLYHKVVSHTLTVNFAGPDDGTFQAPATFTVQIPEGTAYSYDVAELISNNNLGGNVTGYTPNATAITGTMGTEDVTVTVTYRETVVKTERWHEVETIDDVTKDYLIGVEINGQIYLLVNNSTFTSDGTQYTKVGLAAFEGAILTSVSGATDDLTNCRWNFSTTTGGTITSAKDGSKGLYFTANGGLYPDSTPDTWVWGGSAHTMTATVTNTWYMYGTTVNGTLVAGVRQNSSATVHIYREVEDENTNYDVVFVDENGNAYTSIPTQTIKSGEKAAEPNAPEKAEYYFLGWFEEGAAEPFNFNTPIEKDYKLFARYDYMYVDTYTVWLRAVYGIPNTTGKTHIYWYENDGTTVTVTETVNGEQVQLSLGEGAGDRYEQNEINMNVGVDIPTPANWTGRTDANQHLTNREDRIFLGWARVKNESGGAAGTAHPELTEEDLYLKWNGTQYQIWDDKKGEWVNLPTTALNGFGGTVGQVYATEEQPYQDMYAVWATYAYVLHSHTGDLEAIRLRYYEGEQVAQNLVRMVDSDCIYGGYYKTYGGAKDILARADSAANSMKVYKNSAMNQAYQVESQNLTQTKRIETDAETYDGSKTKTQSQSTNGRFWTKAQAYTEPTGDEVTEEDKYNVMGSHMFPEVGTVYYLKEVPESYLTTKYLYTYDKNDGNKIKDFYMLTVTDDSYYKSVGFRTNVGATTAEAAAEGGYAPRQTLSSYFTVTQNGHDPVTVNAATFGVSSGYVGILKDNSQITGGNSFSLMPSWITLDGVNVNSHGGLKLDVNSAKTTVTWKLLTDCTVSTPLTSIYVKLADGFKDSYLHIQNSQNIAATWLYFSGSSGDLWVETTAVDGSDNSLWRADFPMGDWSLMIVVRGNPEAAPSWGGKWNQTNDIQPTYPNTFNNRSGFNMITLDAYWDNGNLNIASVGLYGETP